MRMLIVAALLFQTAAPIQELSEQQILEAIELGRTGKVPIVKVGTFLGMSKGDFDVLIEGPMARIAAAASKAFKQYRPFDVSNVTDEMKSPLFRVVIERNEYAGNKFLSVQRIVLEPKGAKGMDGVVQPFREPAGFSRFVTEALFDRLPDGEFDVVLAISSGAQKYNVSAKDRAKIR